MAGKWVIGMVSVIAIAAVAGIGFATYESTASVQVTAYAGSFYMQGAAHLTASSVVVGSCGASSVGPGSTEAVTATNMLPGDYCNWTITFTDAGSLPGSLVTFAPGYLSGAGCSQIGIAANGAPGPASTVSAGGTAWQFYTNWTDVGNGQVAGSCTGTVSVTYEAT